LYFAAFNVSTSGVGRYLAVKVRRLIAVFPSPTSVTPNAHFSLLCLSHARAQHDAAERDVTPAQPLPTIFWHGVALPTPMRTACAVFAACRSSLRLTKRSVPFGNRVQNCESVLAVAETLSILGTAATAPAPTSAWPA
jgi:hypothetical protein